MANVWFVVRGEREHGPLTSSQLREMASDGRLLQSDLVRRDDTQTPRPATAVKGLFPSGQPGSSLPKLPESPSTQPPITTPDPYWQQTSFIVGSLLLCFPVGLFLVWRNPTWPTSKKRTWTAAYGGVLVILMVLGMVAEAADRRELAEAEVLWRSGDKAGAVTKYRGLVSRLPTNDKGIVYGRLIDFESEGGDAAAAYKLFDDAEKSGARPAVNSEPAKQLARERAVERERKRREAQNAANEATGGDRTGAGNSQAHQSGYDQGLAAGQEYGRIAYSQGRLVTQEEFREFLGGIKQFDCPYPEGSRDAAEWTKGYGAGARKGLGNNLSR